MHKAWYILNYHDISWEEGPFVRSIGGTFPPDIFAEHVATLEQDFKLVSVQEGMRQLEAGIKEPILSFWFDDGFRGVRTHAYPILQRHGVTAGTSINSAFMLREEFFWRLKLSYLAQADGLRFIRSGLRKLGIRFTGNLRTALMDEFSDDALALIDAVYNEHTSEAIRTDAWRLFDDVDGALFLKDNDWVIANHSAAHYPVSEPSCSEKLAEQFKTCEAALNTELDIQTDFWVMPFDRPKSRDPDLDNIIESANPGERRAVFVGNELNMHAELHARKLFRIFVPFVSGSNLVSYLRGLNPHKP